MFGIQGLALPFDKGELLDSEYADDTALYLKGKVSNLRNMHTVLTIFCSGSGVAINWDKSFGIWVGEGHHPDWYPDVSFRWLRLGESVRYLGCQVGIDLPPHLHVAPLLLSLRRKLLFWSSAKLSFAGRIVVTNQVLLASVWYIASAWIFSRASMN
jgi:hypothetical protein